MSPIVYRAVLRLTAPHEYRRLYGRDGKKTVGNNENLGKETNHHGTDIRTAAEA